MINLDFDSILIERCRGYELIFVLVSESPHWSRNGQMWLAQFVAKKINQLGFQATVVAKSAVGWPHHEHPIIELEEFYKLNEAKKSLLVYSAAHNCKLAQELDATFKFNTFDCSAYAIEPKKTGKSPILVDDLQITKALNLFSDVESISCYLNILSSRFFGSLRCVKPSNFRIYFHPAFNNFNNTKGHFIDGGAYDGENSFEFLQFLKPGYKVFGYEFDETNYHNFLEFKSKSDVVFINKGLWSHADSAVSSGSGIAARVEIGDYKNSEKKISQLTSLDLEFINGSKVGFIKLDVEGCEYEAIKGAENIIKRDSPYMAISVYHKPADLWEIPLQIFNINQNYKFYLGQHDTLFSETVLYAVPRE